MALFCVCVLEEGILHFKNVWVVLEGFYKIEIFLGVIENVWFLKIHNVSIPQEGRECVCYIRGFLREGGGELH